MNSFPPHPQGILACRAASSLIEPAIAPHPGVNFV
jgi:hypothetical protein